MVLCAGLTFKHKFSKEKINVLQHQHDAIEPKRPVKEIHVGICHFCCISTITKP